MKILLQEVADSSHCSAERPNPKFRALKTHNTGTQNRKPVALHHPGVTILRSPHSQSAISVSHIRPPEDNGELQKTQFLPLILVL
jgi:hypothetical protein